MTQHVTNIEKLTQEQNLLLQSHVFASAVCTQHVYTAIKTFLEENQKVRELLRRLILCFRKENSTVIRLVVNEINPGNQADPLAS